MISRRKILILHFAFSTFMFTWSSRKHKNSWALHHEYPSEIFLLHSFQLSKVIFSPTDKYLIRYKRHKTNVSCPLFLGLTYRAHRVNISMRKGCSSQFELASKFVAKSCKSTFLIECQTFQWKSHSIIVQGRFTIVR